MSECGHATCSRFRRSNHRCSLVLLLDVASPIVVRFALLQAMMARAVLFSCVLVLWTCSHVPAARPEAPASPCQRSPLPAPSFKFLRVDRSPTQIGIVAALDLPTDALVGSRVGCDQLVVPCSPSDQAIGAQCLSPRSLLYFEWHLPTLEVSFRSVGGMLWSDESRSCRNSAEVCGLPRGVYHVTIPVKYEDPLEKARGPDVPSRGVSCRASLVVGDTSSFVFAELLLRRGPGTYYPTVPFFYVDERVRRELGRDEGMER